MSNPLQNQDAERASLLAELVELSGREELAVLARDEQMETIQANIASRRRALADITRYGRFGAIWKDDRATLED